MMDVTITDTITTRQLGEGITIIDGTNLAYLQWDLREDRGDLSLEPITTVIEILTKYGIAREKIYAFFDANAYYLPLKEQDRLMEGVQQGKFQILPARTNPWNLYLSMAESVDRKFLIISNDSLSNLPTWFRYHRIGVTLNHEKRAVLQIESIYEIFQCLHGIARRK